MSEALATPNWRLRSTRVWTLVGLALVYATLVKLLPYLLSAAGFQFDLFSLAYPWSFTPLVAVGVFCGAMLADRRISLGVLLMALLLSDAGIWLVTGQFSWAFYPLLPIVYACLLATAWAGHWMRQERRPWKPLGLGLALSVLYFVVTNLISWWAMPEYTKDATGLATCFAAALPFFRNMLLGTAFYTAILFSPAVLGLVHRSDAADSRVTRHASPATSKG